MIDPETNRAFEPIDQILAIPQENLPEFEAAFGEPFLNTLDISTWMLGED